MGFETSTFGENERATILKRFLRSPERLRFGEYWSQHNILIYRHFVSVQYESV